MALVEGCGGEPEVQHADGLVGEGLVAFLVPRGVDPGVEDFSQVAQDVDLLGEVFELDHFLAELLTEVGEVLLRGLDGILLDAVRAAERGQLDPDLVDQVVFWSAGELLCQSFEVCSDFLECGELDKRLDEAVSHADDLFSLFNCKRVRLGDLGGGLFAFLEVGFVEEVDQGHDHLGSVCLDELGDGGLAGLDHAVDESDVVQPDLLPQGVAHLLSEERLDEAFGDAEGGSLLVHRERAGQLDASGLEVVVTGEGVQQFDAGAQELVGYLVEELFLLRADRAEEGETGLGVVLQVFVVVKDELAVFFGVPIGV